MHSFLQRLKPASDQEENELVILHLRQLCETKQKSHLHIGEAPKVRAVSSYWLFLAGFLTGSATVFVQ